MEGLSSPSKQFDITLIRTHFEGFINETNGGAIYIHDCTIYFNKSCNFQKSTTNIRPLLLITLSTMAVLFVIIVFLIKKSELVHL